PWFNGGSLIFLPSEGGLREEVADPISPVGATSFRSFPLTGRTNPDVSLAQDQSVSNPDHDVCHRPGSLRRAGGVGEHHQCGGGGPGSEGPPGVRPTDPQDPNRQVHDLAGAIGPARAGHRRPAPLSGSSFAKSLETGL